MASTTPAASGCTRPAPPLPSPVVHLSFSTDESCFVVAGASSVHCLSCDNFELRGLYQEKDASKTIVAAAGDMIHPKDSACATVSRIVNSSRETEPKFCIKRWKPGSKNYHWRYADEEIQTEGKADVRAVRVHGDKTLLVHADRLDVLGHSSTKVGALSLLHWLVTEDNPLGLCAVPSSSSSSQGTDPVPFAFACPGAKVGEVHVERWEGAQRPAVTIRAHSSRLASMAMSCDGRLVATASVTGTLVRIFRAADGALLQEVRGGGD
jgi:WD40 repeat protein